MNDKKPCIVFDFGGVLFDWNPRYLYAPYFNFDLPAVDRFLAEIGFHPWNVELDKGYPFAQAVSELSARFPQHAELISLFDTQWEATFGGLIEPTLAVLAAVKQAGYPLYALSNWSEEKFSTIRPHYEFLTWFDDVCLSAEYGLAKPDPRFYQAFLQRIGQKAGDCLFIDDSTANIAGAQQVGFQTIRFESAGQLQQELVARGVLR